MDGKASSRISLFEYFLYSAIILETALAAFVYKIIFRSSGLLSLNIALAVIYFGFLAWAIIQLNQLHHKRKLEASASPEPPETSIQMAPVAAQSVPLLESGDADRRILGLTGAQLFVILIVFAAAVLSFSWALSILHPEK